MRTGNISSIGRIVLASFWSANSHEAAARRVRQYLRSFGDKLCVVCSNSKDNAKNMKQYYVRFPKFLDWICDRSLSSPALQSNISLKVILRVIHHLTYSLMIPDFRSFWALAAFPTIWRLAPDVLITTGPPMSTHWIGLLTKRLKSSVCWIVDLQDPVLGWERGAPEPKLGLLRRLHFAYARAVISQADGIICATPRIADMVTSHEPVIGKHLKCYVVEIGWEPWGTLPEHTSAAQEDRLVIAYFGNLGPHRPIEPLLDVASRMPFKDKLIFEFYGARGLRPASFDGMVRIQPYVSGELLKKAMAEAFCLLSVQGPAYDYAISSKLMDYWVLDKWILGLVGHSSLERELLIRAGGAIVADPLDYSEIETALRRVYELWIERAPPMRDRRVVNEYAPDLLEGKLRQAVLEIATSKVLGAYT